MSDQPTLHIRRLKRLPSGTAIWEFSTFQWRLYKPLPMWRIINAAVDTNDLRDNLATHRANDRAEWKNFIEEHVRPVCRAPIEISHYYSTMYFSDMADVARYRLIEPDDTVIRFETLKDHMGGLYFVGGYEQYLEYLCAD